MAEYLLGIDNGNTVSKAALFDVEGREIQVASRKVEPDYPHTGWTERSMEVLWRSTAEAVRDAVTASGVDPADIVGVGATGHGNGVYLLDKEGHPARPGIQSMDTRAAAVVDAWNARDLFHQVHPYTLQALWPGQPNALLAWIKRHEPEVYERIGAVLTCKDYIKYRLSGEITTDYSDMSGTSMMDVPNRRYARELLALYDLEELWEAMPPIFESHDVIGKITPEAAEATGLAAGTPVVSGLFDIDASALGAGVFRPGEVCVVAGTWSINEIVTAEPLVDPNLFMMSIYTVPGLWLALEASPTSATNLEWFVTHFCGDERAEAERRGISVYEVCNELVASLPPGGTDVIFHPFLYGSNVQPTARAGFYGVAGWHTKAHLVRALYEGVVYCHLNHIEKLRAAGAQMDVARLTGGGSRSRVWTQMFADALQLPMEVPVGAEMGARGAAMCAGIGAGVYRDHAEAVAKAVKVERRQDPDPEATPHYLARYAEYRRLLQAMQEPWDHLSGLSHH
jgi:L-xylulokinase